jgi:hypothetical protein
MNKKYIIIIILLFFSISIYPQQISTENNNRTTLSIAPYYQTWSGIEDSDINQYSSRFSINHFFNRDIKVSIQGGYAKSEALQNNMSGVSDAQLALNYRLRKFNTAFDVGVNLPTGKEQIEMTNFSSSVLLNQDVFNLRMPVSGQGTNIFAGITWAKDISDNIVICLGASYQVKGEYSPIEDDTITYKPSNELLLTSGIDFRLNKSTTISGDIIGIIYGEDKINDINSFSAGTKIIASLIFKQYYEFNSLIIFLRYRNSDEEKFYGVSEITYSEKINPNNIMVLVDFNHYISKVLTLHYLAEGRFYEKTIAPYSGYNVYGIGIGANIYPSSNFSFPLTAKYYFGNSEDSSSIKGYELGFGLQISF